jgi:L-threonylcarbamoyladenylate synthase
MTEVSLQVLQEALRVIKQGGIVAFPTETYYGLGVDPFQEKALARIFELKKRPLNKAILTLVEGREELFRLTDTIAPVYEAVMEHFWPGPVTLLFPAKKGISPLLTGGSQTIGIRISSHPVAWKLCEMLGQPITATSANLSGRLAAASAKEVAGQLGAGVDFIVDGGLTRGGKGSTLVEAEGLSLKLVREGALPFRGILEVARGAMKAAG